MIGKTVILLALVACALGAQYSNRLNPRPIVPGHARIVGGSDASVGQFPHQVSLQIEIVTNTSNRHLHNCGGSILNEDWILTAGHCVVGLPYEDYLVVVAGEHDLDNEEGTEQVVHVDTIIVHPLYPNLPVVAPNDIALIKLRSPLVLNDRVKAIALPEADVIPTGSSILSGWGSTGGNILFPHMPNILQTSELPLIEYSRCVELYQDSPLEETNLCTGHDEAGIGACSGDSGGPLIRTREDGVEEVIGIVSWGSVPCGSLDAPDVYTRVSAFIDFINESMAQ